MSPFLMLLAMGSVVSGVITPSCSAAAKVIALWTEPGSTTKLVAASSRATGSLGNGLAAL